MKILYLKILPSTHQKTFPDCQNHFRNLKTNSYKAIFDLIFLEVKKTRLEFHRNYYCRMTSRKIQLLVNRRDMKKYDWKKSRKVLDSEG